MASEDLMPDNAMTPPMTAPDDTGQVEPCPFCGGPAKTFRYNGALQATCAGDFKDCAGTDVLAPVEMWNRRAIASRIEALEADLEQAVAYLRRWREGTPTEALEDLTDAFLATRSQHVEGEG